MQLDAHEGEDAAQACCHHVIASEAERELQGSQADTWNVLSDQQTGMWWTQRQQHCRPTVTCS